MPITEAFATRKMCIGPPKQGHAEKQKKGSKYFRAGQQPASSAYDPKLRGGGEVKKVDFITVLKGTGYNPYRAKSGLFTSAGSVGAPSGHDPKDEMRVANLLAKGPKATASAKTMAKSITTWEKAHRRANAAEAAASNPQAGVFESLKAKEISKIFRARAEEIYRSKQTTPATAAATTVKPAEAVRTSGVPAKDVSVAGSHPALPASWQALVINAKAGAVSSIPGPTAAATTVNPAEKAVTEGVIHPGTPTPVTPLGGAYRSRITPSPANAESRTKLQSYMDGFSKGLKNDSERAYAQERVRQMINGETRPSGMSGKFGLTKQRAVQYEALVYKIFQAGRKKHGL